jgi:hypothetical protein
MHGSCSLEVLEQDRTLRKANRQDTIECVPCGATGVMGPVPQDGVVKGVVPTRSQFGWKSFRRENLEPNTLLTGRTHRSAFPAPRDTDPLS